MALIAFAGTNPASFTDGLEVAAAIVEAYGIRDPHTVRAIAASLRSLVACPLEVGIVVGLRLIAEDLESHASQPAVSCDPPLGRSTASMSSRCSPRWSARTA